MRNLQVRLVDSQLIVEQDIDVDGTIRVEVGGER